MKTTEQMNVIARRCLWGGIASLLVGALLSVGWAELSTAMSSADTPIERMVLNTVTSPTVSLLHWSALSIGSALLAAAVIISWMHQNIRLR